MATMISGNNALFIYGSSYVHVDFGFAEYFFPKPKLRVHVNARLKFCELFASFYHALIL